MSKLAWRAQQNKRKSILASPIPDAPARGRIAINATLFAPILGSVRIGKGTGISLRHLRQVHLV
jgi:hypothetical protein